MSTWRTCATLSDRLNSNGSLVPLNIREFTAQNETRNDDYATVDIIILSSDESTGDVKEVVMTDGPNEEVQNSESLSSISVDSIQRSPEENSANENTEREIEIPNIECGKCGSTVMSETDISVLKKDELSLEEGEIKTDDDEEPSETKRRKLEAERQKEVEDIVQQIIE
ncbi:hypothetical protein ACOME3_003444 [Neoechinorhynchus agilis]